MIRGDNAAGSGHVVDDCRRIARDILADMAGDQPSVLVIGAARRIADDESNDFVFAKFCASERRD
jgi:hypothetical protein